MGLKLNTASSGSVSLEPANTASNFTLTVPAQTGTVIASDSSGNVGIGTSSPTKKLEISSGDILMTQAAGVLCQINIAGNGNTESTSFQVRQDASNNALLTNRANGAMLFSTNNTERMRIDSSGNLGLGVTPSAWSLPAFQIKNCSLSTSGVNNAQLLVSANSFYDGTNFKYIASDFASYSRQVSGQHQFFTAPSGTAGNAITFTQAMTLDASGNLLVGKTAGSSTATGAQVQAAGDFVAVVSTGATYAYMANRQADDGALMSFRQANTTEGTISVSGTTVSYNGGHLARWSQLPDGSKDDTLLKGTVLTNLDEMCVWTKDGEQLENEQLNKMKVSDVEGDTNVAGVFVNWTRDEDCNSDDMNIAMTGDMIIRIAQGVTVNRGDLLMSAGDGTAKPQGDDIVRSKTIAKVTSTNITCTYADGSYCVPCVLMAC